MHPCECRYHYVIREVLVVQASSGMQVEEVGGNAKDWKLFLVQVRVEAHSLNDNRHIAELGIDAYAQIVRVQKFGLCTDACMPCGRSVAKAKTCCLKTTVAMMVTALLTLLLCMVPVYSIFGRA